MKGFEEEFMKVEKEGERVGWMKVCPVLLSTILHVPKSPHVPRGIVNLILGSNDMLTNSDSGSRHSQMPIIEI